MKAPGCIRARRPHPVGALLLGLCVASAAHPQTVALQAAPAPSLALGDCLRVEVRAATEGRLLTSAAVALAFDADVLAPVPASVLDGTARPFAVAGGLFPGAVVYENVVQAPAGSSAARARLVVVTGVAVDGERDVARGEGVLASIGFIVVGFGDSAAVELVPGGRDRPAFTDLRRPGVEDGFRLGEPARVAVALDPGGFLPLPDIKVEAGRVAALALSGHSARRLSWVVRSPASSVEAVVDGDSLLLFTRPREPGRIEIEYTARDESGAVAGRGRTRVTVRDAPRRLLDPGVILREDERSSFPLARFLSDEVEVPQDRRWEVRLEEPLEGGGEGDTLRVRAPLDWYGRSALVLGLRSGRDLLDTLRLPVIVAPVNDAPRLALPPAPLEALTGVRTLGPAVNEIVADVDDTMTDLQVRAEGDAFAEAWIESRRLQLRGLQPGTATVTVVAVDPAGARAESKIEVRVAAAAAAPVFLALPPLWLAPGETWAVAVSELVTDPDTPADRLALVARAFGGVTAEVVGDSVRVHAAGPEGGSVRLTATDPEGNQAAAVWSVPGTAIPPAGDANTGLTPAGPAGTPSRPAAEAPSPSPAREEARVGGGSEPGPETAGEGTAERIEVAQPESASPRAPDPPPDPPPDPEPSPAVEIPPGLAFGVLPRLDLPAGTTAVVELADFLDPPRRARVFAVAGARLVRIDLDGDSGRLRVSAPEAIETRELLLITAADADGHRVATTLEVLVSGTGGSLRLSSPPELVLAQGDSAEVDLSAYASGAAGDLVWSATTPSDLVEVEVHGQRLRLRARPAVGGRSWVLLSARDGGGHRAAELLRVRVVARGGGEGDFLRVAAPPDVALTAGDTVAIDLAPLVSVESGIDWRIVDDGGIGLRLDAGTVSIETARDTEAGLRDVELEASRVSSRIRLRFRVAVAPAPALVLRSPPEVTVPAGTVTEPLRLDALVAVGRPEDVEWRVADGGVRVSARVTDGRALELDAREGLPGREMFTLVAAHRGDLRRVSVPVRVRAPRVRLSMPAGGVVAAGDTVVSVDGWVGGELRAADLSWVATSQIDGVEAEWDSASRVLCLRGRGTGAVGLTGFLASSLRVVEGLVPVELGPREDSAGSGPGADGDGAAQVGESTASDDSPPREPWSLVPPSVEPVLPGARVRLTLESLIVGLDPARVSWTVAPTAGTAWIEAGQIVAAATRPFVLRVRAVGPGGVAQELRVAVPVLAAPPRVHLSVSLEVGPEGPFLRVVPSTDTETDSVILYADGRRTVSGALPLPLEPRRMEVVAEAWGGEASGRDTLVFGAVRLGPAGGRLASPDGGLVVVVPARAGTQAVLVTARRGGAYRVERRGLPASLGLWFAAAARIGLGVEESTEGVWVPVSARVTVAPRGVLAFTDPHVLGASYRTVAGERVGSGSVGGFPNPFNASVTLHVGIGGSGGAWIDIYDATGRRLRSLAVRGTSSVVWDGRDTAGREVASGVYVFRVRRPGRPDAVGKVTLLR